MDRIAFMHRLADAASTAIMPHFRTLMDIDDKTGQGFDPVTVADRGAEKAMRALIEAEFPDHGILGEEFGTHQADAETVWVLDPIDGTRAFISGIPLWGVLIGERVKGHARNGMMCQPFTGERFIGTPKGSFLQHNGAQKKLTIRKCADISEATLFTTSPTLFDAREKSRFEAVEAQVRLSRYGADCYAYCMVASGLVDIVIEAGLQAYDIAALVPIIEGAGGRVTTWEGHNPVNGGAIVASGDPDLHEVVLKALS